MKHKLVILLATWFYSGYAPKAPGTAGSLAALPVVWLCHSLQLMPLLAILTIIVTFLGWWASREYLALTGKEGDPKEIVIDEVAGQWLLFAAMPLMYLPASYDYPLALLAAGFIAFRLFDIVKPWPIGLIDQRMKGPWGIMLDDLAAALMGLATLAVIGHIGMGMEG